MNPFQERKIQYSLMFTLVVFLICATLSVQPREPEALAQQIKPLPMSDWDWDYWTNAPDMYTLPTGNVGIGTATPAAKLDVGGTLSVSGTITSTVADGTAPLSVTSTTRCVNLNADMLDGISSANFAERVKTTIPPGGGTKTIELPHCTVFQVVVAEHYSTPQEIAFLWCIENDGLLHYMGFDSAGNLVLGDANIYSVNTLLSLAGGDILLQTQGSGNTLTFSSVYQDCKCLLIK